MFVHHRRIARTVPLVSVLKRVGYGKKRKEERCEGVVWLIIITTMLETLYDMAGPWFPSATPQSTFIHFPAFPSNSNSLYPFLLQPP